MSFLGIGGKKRTVAYTSMTTLWGTSVVPYSGDQAVFDYVMRSPMSVPVTGRTLPDYMMDYYNRSLPPKMRAIKRRLDVNPDQYYYGDVESSFVINNDTGVKDYFQGYLDTLTGYPVTIDYLFFNDINNSHAAWDIFKRLYGYDTNTNQMDTLSAFIGKPVYLQNAQVKYCSDTIARILDTKLLDGIGIGFDFGQTMTRSRDNAKPVTAWVEDTGAINDHVDMSYTFRVDRTRTKVENLYTSTTLSDDTVTDIVPPDPYDSLVTTDLSPDVVDTPTSVKDAPDPLLDPPSSNTATIPAPTMSGLTTSATGGTHLANTFYYVLTATTAAGETTVSNEMNVTTTGSTSKNTVTWSSLSGATNLKLWRGTSTGVYTGFISVGTGTSYIDDNSVALTGGTVPSSNTATLPIPTLGSLSTSTTGGSLPADTYYFKLTAITAAGETSASNEMSITTTGTTSTITVPIPTIAGATNIKVWRGTVSDGQNTNQSSGLTDPFIDNGSVVTPTHNETIRTTTWVSYDDYVCSIDNDFLDYELSGAVDDTNGLDNDSNILDPNISNTFVPSHTGASTEYFMVRYTYNDGTADQWDYFTYQYGSGTNVTLDEIYSTGGIVGDFHPRIYCRLDGQRLDTDALKGTPAYKASVALCKRLGMSWESLSETMHENIGALGDVKQIVVTSAVPANTTQSVEQEYLNKWFHKLFTLLPDVPYQHRDELVIPNPLDGSPIIIPTATDVPGSRTGQTVVMKDHVYEQRLNIGGVRSQEIEGSIGEVGSTSHTLEGLDHTYNLQLTETTYRQVTVYGLQSSEYVTGGYVTNATGGDENLIIPLDNSMFNSLSKRRREELYGRSMRVVINTTQVIKTKWYATGLFQVIMFIIAVIITVITLGAGAPISAAIIATAIAINVAIAIGVSLLMDLLIALGVDPTIAAVISTIVGIVLGGKVSGASLSTAMTAKNLLMLTSAALSIANNALQQETLKILKEMKEFGITSKDKEAELEEAQKLLASTGVIYDPLYGSTGRNEYFYKLGESPDAFISRTIAPGNVGTAVFDFLTNYVSINLQLPSFQSTIQQLNNASSRTD